MLSPKAKVRQRRFQGLVSDDPVPSDPWPDLLLCQPGSWEGFRVLGLRGWDLLALKVQWLFRLLGFGARRFGIIGLRV